MKFGDPRHGALGTVALPSGTKKNGGLIGDQERTVQRGGFAGDELRAQIGEIADVFVFPEKEGIELGLVALALGALDALMPQRVRVDALFVGNLELPARETIHAASDNSDPSQDAAANKNTRRGGRLRRR